MGPTIRRFLVICVSDLVSESVLRPGASIWGCGAAFTLDSNSNETLLSAV